MYYILNYTSSALIKPLRHITVVLRQITVVYFLRQITAEVRQITVLQITGPTTNNGSVATNNGSCDKLR